MIGRKRTSPRSPTSPSLQSDKPRRDVKLRDVRIEDGTVNIRLRRERHREAHRAYRGKSQPADAHRSLHRHRQVRLEGANRRFQLRADLARRSPPEASGEARACPRHAGHRRAVRRQHADPAGLHRPGRAVRQGPVRSRRCSPGCGRSRPLPTAIGDGELASHVEWKKGEITLSAARFALEHAQRARPGGGHLKSPRPACQSGAGARLSRPQSISVGRPGESGRCPRQAEQAAERSPAPRAESAMPRQRTGERSPAARGRPESGLVQQA